MTRRERPEKQKMTTGDIKASFSTRSFRVGTYSIFAILVVIAIAVIINLAVSLIPSKYTKLDTTYNQMLTLSEQTKQIVGAVDKDVTIYWMVSTNMEDSSVQTLLEFYEGLNSHVTVEKINPVAYPNFAAQYTDLTIFDNSLIVVCGDRSQYVSYYKIFVYDYTDYYTTGEVSITFDGEGALTSAINFVTSEDLPKMYVLNGHGELALGDSIVDLITKDGIETEDLNLVSYGEIPEDCDCLLINSPASDLSAQEAELILEYLKAGGKLVLNTDYVVDGDFKNLMSITEYYGATLQDGIVLESSAANYAWGYPFYLLASMNSHDITDPLIAGNYSIIMPVAQGITVTDTGRSTLTVTEILTTTNNAFSKPDAYNMTTYDKEDGDIEGPFALGLAISEGNTKIVWFSTSQMLDDTISSMVSGSTQDIWMNGVNWACEQENTISIRAKTMYGEYFTIDSSTASLISVIIIGVIPVAFLAVGIVVFVRRKRR